MAYSGDWRGHRSGSNVIMMAIGIYSTAYGDLFGTGITVNASPLQGSGSMCIVVSNAVGTFVRHCNLQSWGGDG